VYKQFMPGSRSPASQTPSETPSANANTTAPAATSVTRERLLAAGQALARRDGLRALTVRGVAKRSGVNLGSFVYHFKTRDNFLLAVLERWYAPLFEQLQLDARVAGDPVVALRAALLHLVDWLLTHRAFVVQLLLDAGAGEVAARRFLQGIDQRHPAVLHGLIERAQAAGRLQRGDPWHQLMFLMSTVAVPMLLFHVTGRRGVLPPVLADAVTAAATDATAIEQRLGWALAGLRPDTLTP
jgi:AcrR family transcriptional regulator